LQGQYPLSAAFFRFTGLEDGLGDLVLLRQASIAMQRLAEEKTGKMGLTPEKLAVLWMCKNSKRPLTPAQIARVAFRENQTVAGLLNRMEKEGFLKRTPKRKGQPYTAISMTGKGEDSLERGLSSFKELIDLLPRFSESTLAELDAVLRKATQTMHTELIETHLSPSW